MNTRGQSLMEFMGVLAVAVPFAIGGARLLGAWNDRLRCAHRVFEDTRAAAEGRSSLLRGTTLRQEGGWFHGSGRCGQAVERVSFPELESWEQSVPHSSFFSAQAFALE